MVRPEPRHGWTVPVFCSPEALTNGTQPGYSLLDHSRDIRGRRGIPWKGFSRTDQRTGQLLLREDEVLLTARVRVACVSDGRPARLPAWVREKLEA